MTLSHDVEGGEFVQILNNQRGHWLTISTIDTSHPTVNVYDSRLRTAGTRIKAQIASLLHTKAKEITLNFINVHIQAGGSSGCGLFAIANATALAFGNSPGNFQYHQEKMRQHLWQCFEKREMALFPVRKRRRSPDAVVTQDPFSVYCVCRMPEIFQDEQWVECSHCQE